MKRLKPAKLGNEPLHHNQLEQMYRKSEQPELTPDNFQLSSLEKLSPNNRWVIMAELVPWDEFEAEYAKLFDPEKGAPAKSFRLALGTLIIKEKLGTSDRETIEQIKENPYLQYFIGLTSYQELPTIDASMLVHFRKRISVDLVNKIKNLFQTTNHIFRFYPIIILILSNIA